MFTFIHSAFVTDDVLVRVVCSFVCFFQGGRRDFSRREITALVGSPGNMAVSPYFGNTAYRRSITCQKQRTAYRQNIAVVLHYHRKKAIFWFYRFSKKSTANSRYRRKVLPTLNTAKRVPPTLDTAQKVPPTLDTAQKVPPMLASYHRKGTAYTGYRPKKYRLFSWCSFFVLRSFWFFGLLFGRTSLWT